MGKWKIPGFQQIAATEESDWNPKHIDFIKHPKGENVKDEDRYSIVVVGSNNSNRQCMKVLNVNNKLLRNQDFKLEDGELTQSVYIRSSRGRLLQSIAVGTTRGEVWTILHPHKLEGANKQLAHRGSVTVLGQTLDQNVLFSAGEDGCLFVYKLSEEKVSSEATGTEE